MFLSFASGNMIVMSISVGGDDFIAEQSDFEVLMEKYRWRFAEPYYGIISSKTN